MVGGLGMPGQIWRCEARGHMRLSGGGSCQEECIASTRWTRTRLERLVRIARAVRRVGGSLAYKVRIQASRVEARRGECRSDAQAPGWFPRNRRLLVVKVDQVKLPRTSSVLELIGPQ